MRIIYLLACILSLLFSSTENASNIKYFGYYYGTDGIYQTSSYINVGFVANERYARNIEELARRDIYTLLILDSVGSKGILDGSGVFFDQGLLRPDWEARWNTYWRMLYPYLSMILAFYPTDEPDLNVSMRDYTIVVNAIKDCLNTVHYPIEILMVVSSPTVVAIRDGAFLIPQNVSWIGFDEYGCWNDCSLGISIPEKFQILVNNAKQNPYRKVVVIPGAVVPGISVPSLEKQSYLAFLIDRYYQMCKSEPLCIGMFPFLWKTLPDVGDGLIGTDNMPIVENRLSEIGTRIKFPPIYSYSIYLPIIKKGTK